MEKNILVLIPFADKHRQALAQAASDCEIIYSSPEEVTAAEARKANIVIGALPVELVPCVENLELMQLSSAGADKYTSPGLLPEGVVLCCSSGAYNQAVTEHMFALMLCLIKKLHLYRDNMRAGIWRSEGSISSLVGATVLIAGFGELGMAFARLCKPMGAKVIGLRRRAGVCPPEADELYTTEDLDRLLPSADVVLSVLPSTPATRGIFNSERFALMKKSAVFLNGGRGDSVVADDLCEALHNGVISAAAVDVTDPEPLPAEHPLWQEPNVFITPHVAGFFYLEGTFDRVVDIAVGNVSACLLGKPFKNVVDMKTGYKK